MEKLKIKGNNKKHRNTWKVKPVQKVKTSKRVYTRNITDREAHAMAMGINTRYLEWGGME